MAENGPNEWSMQDQENLFWYLVTAYIADTAGLLDDDKKAKLASFEPQAGGDTWQEYVRNSLDVDDTMIRSIYAICTERKDSRQALGFILRGLGCPNADERLREVVGTSRS